MCYPCINAGHNNELLRTCKAYIVGPHCRFVFGSDTKMYNTGSRAYRIMCTVMFSLLIALLMLVYKKPYALGILIIVSLLIRK